MTNQRVNTSIPNSGLPRKRKFIKDFISRLLGMSLTLRNYIFFVFKNIENFRKDSSLYTWIYRIATNEALSILKKNKQKQKHTHTYPFFLLFMSFYLSYLIIFYIILFTLPYLTLNS